MGSIVFFFLSKKFSHDAGIFETLGTEFWLLPRNFLNRNFLINLRVLILSLVLIPATVARRMGQIFEKCVLGQPHAHQPPLI